MILKIIAVIAMVLAIAHAAMPAFGQKPNNSAGNRYAHNNNGDKGKSPSHAPTISETKETAGPAPKSDSDSQPDKLDQDSINIRNPTPMSKPWGWREWIPWSGNLLLVLVGIVGVVVAVVTLAAIKRQAKIMETQARHMADQLAEIKRQADVMEEQIQATKSRERARLVGTPTVFEYFDADNLPFGQFLELEVENVGYSHAFDVSIEGRCEVTINSISPEGGETSHSAVGTVRLGGEKMKGSLPIIATDEMWDNVIKPGTKDLHMHLWGVMRYKDVFGDEQTERFRFSNWIQSVKEATQQYGSMRYPVVSLFGWENDRETEDQSQNQNPT